MLVVGLFFGTRIVGGHRLFFLGERVLPKMVLQFTSLPSLPRNSSMHALNYFYSYDASHTSIGVGYVAGCSSLLCFCDFLSVPLLMLGRPNTPCPKFKFRVT